MDHMICVQYSSPYPASSCLVATGYSSPGLKRKLGLGTGGPNLHERSWNAMGANRSASIDRSQNALGAGGSNLRGRSRNALGAKRSALRG
jgi:hypothetical protein